VMIVALLIESLAAYYLVLLLVSECENVCQAGTESGLWCNGYRCRSKTRFCRVTMIRDRSLTVSDYAVVFRYFNEDFLFDGRSRL